ncbi:MAG: hypothetical protein IPI60_06110 [Saprospiraceae bacterium]|nr:hypothetical protein [Saprospiraceae bacterium]
MVFSCNILLDGGSTWTPVGELKSGWHNYSSDNNNRAFDRDEPYFSGKQGSFKITNTISQS